MKSWLMLALLAPLSLASAGTAKISGTVVDQGGTLTPNIVVEASPVGMAWSGGIPQAKTDEHGHFVLTVVSGREAYGTLYGQHWLVYVHQDDAYYPDLSSAFYSTPSTHAQTVELTPESGDAIIELKAGPKAGAITGHVIDSVTGTPLHPQFDLAWASGDPSKRMGIRTRDPYRILLPSNTEIKLIVQCEGHKPWIYPGVINVGPAQDLPLDIKMDPEPASK